MPPVSRPGQPQADGEGQAGEGDRQRSTPGGSRRATHGRPGCRRTGRRERRDGGPVDPGEHREQHRRGHVAAPTTMFFRAFARPAAGRWSAAAGRGSARRIPRRSTRCRRTGPAGRPGAAALPGRPPSCQEGRAASHGWNSRASDPAATRNGTTRPNTPGGRVTSRSRNRRRRRRRRRPPAQQPRPAAAQFRL